MCDLIDWNPEKDGDITAFILNVKEPSSIWADFYTGPSGITMTIVFLVIIGMWAGAFLLNFFL